MEPGQLVFDEFRVERHLGRGGFGSVELVTSRRSGQRYAMKHLHAADTAAMGRFLSETHRWMALPAHPNITPCHFVRSHGSELMVFSEYVEAGSLRDWIRSGRLYEPAGTPVRERILDIARQAAWGLGAAHREGLLHLDMKPANVLLTEAGECRITDFGLAATGERDAGEVMAEEAALDYIAGSRGQRDATFEVIRSSLRRLIEEQRSGEPAARAEGFSVGYVSPEQAEGALLGPAADVWSWALTVLEMFVGERTWPSGTVAAAVLNSVVAGDAGQVREPVPPAIAALLAECFHTDPAQRPAGFAEVTERLAAAARSAGIPLLRDEPPPPPERTSRVTQERFLISGGRWGDPRDLLRYAYEAAGLDPRDAVQFWPRQSGDRRAQALEDLRALAEAARVLDTVPAPLDVSQLYMMAGLHFDSGTIHTSLGNTAGAVHELTGSVRLLTGIVTAEPAGDDYRSALVVALNALALALREHGDVAGSIATADRAIDNARRVTDGAAGRRLLGLTLLTRANAMEPGPQRLAMYDDALAATRSDDDEGHAKALAAKAATLARLGRRDEAGRLWATADEMLGRMAHGGRRDLIAAQGRNHLGRATDAPPEESLEYATKAVDALRPLVEDFGWHELVGDLGSAEFLAGYAHEQLDRPQAALAAYRSARQRFQTAVLRDGRADLVDRLARAFDFESTLIRTLESPLAAVEVARQAVALWQRLDDGTETWIIPLALAHTKLGTALSVAGDPAAASAEFDRVLTLLADRDDAPAARVLAQVRHERGILSRRAGRPEEAIDEYRRGLAALDSAGADDPHNRLLLLESMSAVFSDARQYERALQILEQAVAGLEALAGTPGQRPSDLADTHQRRANVFIRLGRYRDARAAAAASLAGYTTLIEGGRTDLLFAAARVRSVYAIACERDGDPLAAIEALRAARAEFVRLASGPRRPDGPPDEMVPVLDRWVDRLTALAAIDADTVDAYLTRIGERLDWCAELSRAGHVDEGVNTSEEVIGELLWLRSRHPVDGVFALLGRAGAALGIMAMYAGLDGVTLRGFDVAIVAYGELVERGRGSEHVEAWVNAHIGLACHRAMVGDRAGEAEVLAKLDRDVARIDPTRREHWARRARTVVSAARRDSAG